MPFTTEHSVIARYGVYYHQERTLHIHTIFIYKSALSRNYRLIVKKYPMMSYSCSLLLPVLCTPYLQREKKNAKRMENKLHRATPALGLFELTQFLPSFLFFLYCGPIPVSDSRLPTLSTTTGQEIGLACSTASCMRWTDTTEY